MSGSRCGTDGRSEYGDAPAREGTRASCCEPKRDVASFELGIGAFVDDEGGYTSVAVALALLVSLSLVCSLVSVAWVQNRSADVQSVADSAALAGANVVAAYSTVATTLDACVLTLGLAGMVTLGAGLVVSAVPGLSAVGAETISAGVKMLDARREFAMSAASRRSRRHCPWQSPLALPPSWKRTRVRVLLTSAARFPFPKNPRATSPRSKLMSRETR